MFKSTKDFDTAMYKILVSVRDTNSFSNVAEYDETELGDAINECISNGYLTNIDCEKNLAGEFCFCGTPKITYSGLNFIENFN